MHSPGDSCPCCGGTRLTRLGEDVTEVLERVPARLKVIRHIRPRLSCRACETIIQAPAPDLPVEKGRPGPALIANVVVCNYIDGLPLHRQAGIIARDGVDIDRASLYDWVGRAAWWLAPISNAIAAHVRAAPVIHTDDTPNAVLSPGRGGQRYCLPEPRWGDLEAAKDAKLSVLVERGVSEFLYIYDMGDSWDHLITIEAIEPATTDSVYPRLIGGARREPPEDVGGFPGYENFLEAIADPDHEEHDEPVEWYGGPDDADDIDEPRIRRGLTLLAGGRTTGTAAATQTRKPR